MVDGHPVHRAVKIKEWLEENADHISLFFLPGYSPELNPDEILNQDVKSNALGRRRPHNEIELVENVRGYLRKSTTATSCYQKLFQRKTR
ncbi:MAG: transposase [Deltaproteobacteria bacterium]|nr:transposase [Deltaproteobacteria bacterium]